jgi:hypothetical protein
MKTKKKLQPLTDRYGRPLILSEQQIKNLIDELTNLIK